MNSIYEDMHIHSTFSDGKHSVYENIKQAESLGLKRICCVDHVRNGTDWTKDFAKEVRLQGKATSLDVYSGVETKLLNTGGDLDLPDNIDGIDYIYVADHQFPTDVGPVHPKEIRKLIKEYPAEKNSLVQGFADSVIGALNKHKNVVLAHLFSVFPKAGLVEDEVPETVIKAIASAARRNGAQLEIDERWKCPSLRTARIFMNEGVPIVFSTDSHRKESIGVYQYNQALYDQLIKQ